MFYCTYQMNASCLTRGSKSCLWCVWCDWRNLALRLRKGSPRRCRFGIASFMFLLKLQIDKLLLWQVKLINFEFKNLFRDCRIFVIKKNKKQRISHEGAGGPPTPMANPCPPKLNKLTLSSAPKRYREWTTWNFECKR